MSLATVQEKDSSTDYVEDRKESSQGHEDLEDHGFLLDANRRPSAEKALLRKLDYRVLPTIVVIYIMNYIDVSYMIFNLENRAHCILAYCGLFGQAQRFRA